MAPGGRGTRTGALWERVIRPVLDEHYAGRFQSQQQIGNQLFGKLYRADYVLNDPSGDTIVSAKWQQEPGSTEEKLLYDIASLVQVVRDSRGRYRKAYLVLGGGGFSKAALGFLKGQGHMKVLTDGALVEVLSFEDFITRANKKNL